MENPVFAMDSWKKLFLVYPIFDNICAHLDPPDILALQGTTKQLSRSFEALFKTQWNINRRLRRFVKDPIHFRSQMAKFNALISGSFALQFFARTMWPDADLDIWVEGGISEEEDANDLNSLDFYLQEQEGYTKQRQPHEVSHYGRLVQTVHMIDTYSRKLEGQRDTRRIQITYTKTSPLHCIMGNCSHTAVVNFITWDFAYSMFPDLTFVKKKSYYMNNSDNSTEPFLADQGKSVTKYTKRGWHFAETVENGSEDEKSTKSLILSSTKENSHRRVGDSFCWKISLDTSGVESDATPSFLEYSTFGLRKMNSRGEPPLGHPANYKFEVKLARSCVLKHNYACKDITPIWIAGHFIDPIMEYPAGDFWSHISQKLHDLTGEELLKIPEDQRPFPIQTEGRIDQYKAHVDEILASPPIGWTFYDEKIPEWYADYEKDTRRG